jgi:hypothetical protein
LAFAQQQTGNEPCQLDFGDLDAPLIGAFLNHLEQDRGNSRKTRNARLAAIHSLHRYAALRHPEHAATIARETVTILDPWLRERKGAPPEPLFPTRHGDRRARDRRRR